MGKNKIGNLDIVKKKFGTLTIVKEVLNGVVIYEESGPGPTPVIDPILENNSWDVIKSVCEAGTASTYWSVGDTKTDVGTDNITRTFRIVDMSGLYNKHVVFEQVGLEGTDGTGETGVIWNNPKNNNYSTSNMNLNVLPSVITRYSFSLQSALTNTTIQSADSGDSSSANIINVTSKLFLAAGKEMNCTRYSSSVEKNVLTTFSYYKTHTSNADHIKYDNLNTNAYGYYLRSPRTGNTSEASFIYNTGVENFLETNYAGRFSPCFAF